MKVVVNTRSNFLRLSEAEIRLVGVDNAQFRTHPVLVQLVEEGKLQGLVVVEIPDGTDYEVMTYDDRFGRYSQEHHNYHYCGEIVVRKGPSEWFPEGMGNCDFNEEYVDEDEANNNQGEVK